jgi:hypothetical protein
LPSFWLTGTNGVYATMLIVAFHVNPRAIGV